MRAGARKLEVSPEPIFSGVIVVMKTLSCIAAAALLSAGCADQPFEPEAPVVSNTILVPGNQPSGPGCPPNPDCLAPIDAEVKDLYERNNRLSQPGDGTVSAQFHGESEYQAASHANNSLTRIWYAYEMEASVAIGHLENYITYVTRAVTQGTYSQCAAGQLINRANWIIGLIQESAENGFTSDLLATRTPYDCALSPVIPSGSGNVTTGVSLSWQDPWGFQTRYEVQLPGGTTVTTTEASFNDAATILPGTYTYNVRQCATGLSPSPGCSVWTSVDVTIADPASGPPPATCTGAHDNRNGGFIAPPTGDRCAREAVETGKKDKDPVVNPGKGS